VPRLKGEPIVLTDRQRALLERILRREKSTQQQIRRTQVILAAAEQWTNRRIAKELDLTLKTVRLWRRRWIEVSQAMHTAEKNGDIKQLEQLIAEALTDEGRSGRPARFTPEQICKIVAMGCEQPEDSQRPISHWTARELADEAIKRGIVDNISPRSAGRFFKRSRP
jgi:putative transposase